MRQARIRGEGKSYYHCISRVVDRQFVLKEEEKEHFVALMRKLEAFHGMRVVTYCIMSNHFHLLIEEPDRESVASLESETIFRRIGFLYDSFTVRTIQKEWERARAAGDAGWEEEILDRYRVRYLTAGAVLGSEAFVNQVFERNRSKVGKTRQSGARPMCEADWSGLCVLRDLRDEVMIPTPVLRES